jgi:PAS domain S-box-containing protein
METSEAVLQRSQQQWQTIFNQTFQFIGLLQPDGVLIDANRAALEFVEATLEQVVGRPFWQTPWWIHDPEQQQSLQAAIAEAATGQFVRHEFTHCSARGTIETFDFSINPILSETGQVISLVAEGRNIEERKRLEQQLQAAHEELEQRVADRTQELSRSEEQFRVLATHAPVGIFQTDAVGDCVFVNQRWLELTGLSLAQAMGPGWANALHPEDRERVWGEWSEAAQSGQDFYSEYRFQTPQGQVVWVIGSATALQDETGGITGYLGTVTDITDRKQAEAAVQQSEDKFRRFADATQLHQVFINLCVNARDAMPDGGTLTIAAENCVLDPTLVAMHPDAQVGSYLKVSMSDTGTGIAPEMRDRIFDPFFTTKEPGKGTGLGLSTVMKIIKTHQGFLHLTTQGGQGTCFTVYLPALV